VLGEIMFAKRLKILRTEKKWSQAELAEKIGIGTHVISRYENGKIMPAAEKIMRIAEIFDVSCDYLLFENATRKSFRLDNPELSKRMIDIVSLNDEDRGSLFHMLDALLAKEKLKALAREIN